MDHPRDRSRWSLLPEVLATQPGEFLSLRAGQPPGRPSHGRKPLRTTLSGHEGAALVDVPAGSFAAGCGGRASPWHACWLLHSEYGEADDEDLGTSAPAANASPSSSATLPPATAAASSEPPPYEPTRRRPAGSPWVTGAVLSGAAEAAVGNGGCAAGSRAQWSSCPLVVPNRTVLRSAAGGGRPYRRGAHGPAEPGGPSNGPASASVIHPP